MASISEIKVVGLSDQTCLAFLDAMEAAIKSQRETLYVGVDLIQHTQTTLAVVHHEGLNLLSEGMKSCEGPMDPTLSNDPNYIARCQQWPPLKARFLVHLRQIEDSRAMAMDSISTAQDMRKYHNPR